MEVGSRKRLLLVAVVELAVVVLPWHCAKAAAKGWLYRYPTAAQGAVDTTIGMELVAAVAPKPIRAVAATDYESEAVELDFLVVVAGTDSVAERMDARVWAVAAVPSYCCCCC